MNDIPQSTPEENASDSLVSEEVANAILAGEGIETGEDTEDKRETAPERDPETGRFTPKEDSEEDVEAVAEAEPEEAAPEEASGDEEVEEGEPETAIDPPLSWTAEAKEAFEQLPPDLQGYIADRESERERGINTKLSEAAEERKAAEAAQQEAAAQRQEYAETLQQLIQFSSMMDPIIAEGNQTNWAQLADEDPENYTRMRARYDERVGVMQAVYAEFQRVGEQQREYHQTEAQKRLAEAMPEFADSEQAAVRKAEYSPILSEAGITADEIAQFWSAPDPRYVRIIDDAAKWRKHQAAQKSAPGKKVSPTATKAIRPKASNDQPVKSNKLAELEKRAAKTGRETDLVDFVTASLLEG